MGLSKSVVVAGCVLVGAALQAQGVSAVLPNGREIRPVGTWTQVAPYPFGMAVRPDGRQAVVSSIGFPFALNVITDPAGASPRVKVLADTDRKSRTVETHAGLAYSPDGALLYAATGDSGKVDVYDTTTWKKTASIALNGVTQGRVYKDSFAAMVMGSRDGRWLFALDQGNWRVVVIDAKMQRRVASVPTGAYPFAMALSPDQTRLYVTNSGLFEYKPVPGVQKDDVAGTGLTFPPFGYPSKAAREGAMVEGHKIPGLGDENSVRGSSLWSYAVSSDGQVKVSAKLRLGRRVDESGRGVIGGAAPTGVAAADDAVYVALAHEDSVVKVSADGERVLAETPLTPFHGRAFEDAAGHALRGVMPSGVAVRDGRVYVAEAGINAVGGGRYEVVACGGADSGGLDAGCGGVLSGRQRVVRGEHEGAWHGPERRRKA